MNRVVKSIPMGDGQTRWRLLLEDDFPASTGPDTDDERLMRFMRTIADQPALLQCGPVYPKSFFIQHSGIHWALTADVVVRDEQST